MLKEIDINTFLINKGWEAREKKIPIGITFELTPRCNLKCKMCYVRIDDSNVSRYGRELSAAEWISLGEQAVKEGSLTVQLTGGEVFLRNDFFEIYEALSDLGLRIYISTNGTRITQEIAHRLAKRPPLSVTVSLYGASADTYQRLCSNPSGFHDTLRGIENLVGEGITPKLTFTLTKENKEDTAKVKEIMSSYGLEFSGTNRLFHKRAEAVGNSTGMQVDVHEMRKVMESLEVKPDSQDLRRLREKIEHYELIKMEAAEEMKSRKGFLCAAGRAHFWINWKGEMRPCGMEKNITAYPLSSSVGQAWESIVKECEERVSAPERCGTCNARPFCIICQTGFKDKTGSYDIPPLEHCRLSLLELLKTNKLLKINNV